MAVEVQTTGAVAVAAAAVHALLGGHVPAAGAEMTVTRTRALSRSGAEAAATSESATEGTDPAGPSALVVDTARTTVVASGAGIDGGVDHSWPVQCGMCHLLGLTLCTQMHT